MERKKLADENFTFALDAVQAQVFDIYEQLKIRPGTRNLREKLQKNATERLKTLVERTSRRAQVDLTSIAAHNNLGDIYLKFDRKPTLAREQYQEAFDIARAIVAADPNDFVARRQLTVSYQRLGNVSLQTGETVKALEYYQKSLDEREELARANPNDSQARRDLSISYDRLGKILLRTGDVTKSLEYYQMSLELRKRLATSDPQDIEAQLGLVVSYNKVGDVYSRTGETAKALESFQKGLEVSEPLARSHPDNLTAQRGLSISYENLGDLSLKTGEMTKALEYITLCLGLATRLSQADTTNAGARRDLEICSLNQRLGTILPGVEQPRDNAERLALARWAYLKKLPALSARLYAEAMEADPNVGDDRNGLPRFFAINAASIASSGQGFDFPKPDDAAKAKLRTLAFGWLKAELAFWERYAKTMQPQENAAIVSILDGW